MPIGGGTDVTTLSEIDLVVNGATRRLSARPYDVLLDVLREQLQLLSVREGCGVGMCGACTVLIDDQPVSSCLMLVEQARGHELTTLEGLPSPDGHLDSVQQAFLEATAFQCSYCTPGFILSTRGLLNETLNPTDQEIKEYLAGNLCRCGSYVKILEAVKNLSDSTRSRANDV